MAKAIYEGTLTEGDIDPDMVNLVGKHLTQAVVNGYGKDFPDVAYGTPDHEMLANLQKNVYSFSAAKNYQELKSLTMAITDDNGKVRKFSEFSRIAQQIDKQYNVTWLQTEYNTAIGSGQMAGRWVEFEKNKDIMPLLRYQTSGDARVRTEHRLLDNITRPMDDEFWDKYYPPNGWGCRCDVLQIPSGAETPADKLNHPEVPPMWSVNLAKRGLAFPPNHQYFNGVPEVIIEKGKGLIDDYTEEDIKTLLSNKDFQKAKKIVESDPKYQNQPGFTTDELATICHYTSQGYADLNSQLRSGNLSKFNTAFEKVLNATLDKLPKDTQLSYFRGTSLPKEVIDTYEMHWKNNIPKTEQFFYSTSKEFTIADEMGSARKGEFKCIFNVYSKNGRDVSKLSNAVSPESEVLLKSKTRFDVMNVKPKTIGNETTYEIDLVEKD
jgi:SPP1 gp7 family putative phage head morphogenesis protein